jgi:hypothetical protein
MTRTLTIQSAVSEPSCPHVPAAVSFLLLANPMSHLNRSIVDVLGDAGAWETSRRPFFLLTARCSPSLVASFHSSCTFSVIISAVQSKPPIAIRPVTL